MKKQLYKSEEKAALIKRIEAIKDFLPPMVHRIIFKKHPRYATLSGRDKIKNVLYLKCTDEKLTRILEKISEEYKANTQKSA